MLRTQVPSQTTLTTLLPMSLGMLYESRFADQPWTNLEQIVLRFRPHEILPDRVRAALQALSERHDALRLMFHTDAVGNLGQSVAEGIALPFSLHRLDDGDHAHSLQAFLEADRTKGFALDDELPWRAHFLTQSDAPPILVLTLHHAIADGRSFARLVQELLEHLETGTISAADPNALTYQEACTHLLDQSAQALEAGETAFLQSYLGDSGASGELELPEQGETVSQTRRKIRSEIVLGAQTTSALTRLAQRCDATLANVVQAAWGLLLARWQGKADVTFGTVRSGRHSVPGTKDTVGCLITTLPLRIKLSSTTTLHALLSGLRQTTIALHPHEHIDQERLRAFAGLSGRAALFDTSVMFENATLEELVLHGQRSDLVAQIELLEEGGQALALAAYAGDELRLMIEHDPAVIPDHIAAQLPQNLRNLLRSFAAADEHVLLGALDMLPAPETAQLMALALPEHTHPEQTLPQSQETNLMDWFDRIVRAHGADTALMDGGSRDALTYAQLDQRATVLAHRLIEHGVRDGEIVAIRLPRSIEFIVSLLAIWKVGGAFLPIDPTYPEATQHHMLDDSGARLMLSDTPATLDLSVTVLDPRDDAPHGTAPSEPRAQRISRDNAQLAYMIYTSGSTGKPKGVRVSRGNILAHLNAMIPAFDLTAQDAALQFASLSFDVALEETLTTLMSGATLVLRNDEMAHSPRALLDAVERHKISVLNLPTAFWTILTQALSDTPSLSVPACVRLVVVGGERVPSHALRQWQELAPNTRWLNGYGPTETTITCTLFEPGARFTDTDVPIGRATAHATCFVLAPDGSLSPKGARGELAIGGPAVTLGYHNRPEDTAKSFRPDPRAPSDRLYLTGDRAQWRSDDQLAFHGRADSQIKLRGFRIDLRHVERAVEAALPDCEVIAGIVNKDKPTAQLASWVCGPAETDLETAQIALENALPKHMVPKLVQMDAFPRTAGGKIDKSALPAPSASTLMASKAQPDHLTEREAQICALMAELLGHAQVSPDQSFFDIGGHSLLSVQLISRIEARFGKRIGMAAFQDNATPRALSALIDSDDTQISRNIVSIQPLGTKPVLLGIHILGAEESYFEPLAAYLGTDQPVMGVSVGSLDENTPTGVESIAQCYCDEIDKCYPEGPVHLMAVSLGSYMAFEVAQQLRARGRDVGLIALFDAAGPGGRDQVQGLKRLWAHAKKVYRMGWRAPIRIVRNRLFELRNARVARRLQRESTGNSIQAPQTVAEFIAANELAVTAYTPLPLDVPLTIFRASENDYDTEIAKTNGLGWASVAQAGLTVIDTPGGHLSLLQEPNTPALAQRFTKALDAANARVSTPQVQNAPVQYEGAPQNGTPHDLRGSGATDAPRVRRPIAGSSPVRGTALRPQSSSAPRLSRHR